MIQIVKNHFWFIVSGIVLIFCRIIASQVLPTFDDAFITYRYAINLISYGSYVYNLNEHVLGTTSPLFGLICTIPIMLHISIVKFVVILNILMDLSSLYIVFNLLKSKDLNCFIIFTLLFSLSPILNRVCIGGMEVNIFLFFSLLSIVLTIKGNFISGFSIATILYFIRPESLILIGVLFIFDFYKNKRVKPYLFVLVALILILPLIVINMYYGSPFSQSLIAKSHLNREPVFSLFQGLLFSDFLFIVLFPFTVYGIIIETRNRVFGYFSIIVLIWTCLFLLAYLIKAPQIWTWYPQAIHFAQILFASIGLKEVLQKMIPGKVELLKYFILLPLIIWIGISFIKGKSKVENNIYSELKIDFSSANFSFKKIMANDIGAIGFFSNSYIFDSEKLVTPQANRYNNFEDMIFGESPDALFINLNKHNVKILKYDYRIKDQYKFIKRYSISGEKTFILDTNLYDNKYKQDYILLKKL